MSRDPGFPVRDAVIERLEVATFVSAVLGEPPHYISKDGRHLAWDSFGLVHAGRPAYTVVLDDDDDGKPALTVDMSASDGGRASKVSLFAIVGAFRHLLHDVT